MKKTQLFMLLSFVLFGNGPLRAQWGLGGNNITAFSRLGSNNFQPLRFYTSGLERGRITPTGLWGIGTSTPNAKLHINSVTGQIPFRVQVNGLSKLVVHSSGGVSIGSIFAGPANGLYVAGKVGIGTIAPQSKFHVAGSEILSTGFQAGYKFRNRNSASAADDWAWYSEGNIARFWKHGTGDLLGITATGNVGIGTIAPGNYRLRINHGNYGLDLQQASTGSHWEIYTAPSNALGLFYNGVFKGSFSTTGAYTQASDERLKTNIQPMPSLLDKINQLKPTTYQFKLSSIQAVNSAQEYGFIAQEVMKVFPHLVKHNVDNARQLDAYTVDYSGFGVLAIKGLQEMQKTIVDQQQKISTLENRLASIEAVLNATNRGNGTSSVKNLSGVVLEQNQPNPFTQSTTFRYQIPADAQAQIIIYEVSSGNLVKTMPAPANGQVQLNGNDLKAGTYVYTLVVNGKLAASKVMVLSK